METRTEALEQELTLNRGDDDRDTGERKEYVERKRWVFFGLPFTFTKYTVTDEVITINEGLLNTKENDCYLYKIQDVELQVSLAERIFGLGTVACYTGDNTHPQLFLTHIRNAREIKNYILKAAEEARRKRRTLNTLNINASDIDEDDL
ncbi:MAG: PH domain-containing protein [Lachnospiraceae bacterium]|nr:PH domain-containing protein [Lachnospiraceae bacterium]